MQLQRGGNALERVGQTVGFFELSGLRLRGKDPVSYTHLTLPTIYSV